MGGVEKGLTQGVTARFFSGLGWSTARQFVLVLLSFFGKYQRNALPPTNIVTVQFFAIAFLLFGATKGWAVDFEYVRDTGRYRVKYELVRDIQNCKSKIVTVNAVINGEPQALIGVMWNDSRVYYINEAFINDPHVGVHNDMFVLDASSPGSGQVRMFYLFACTADGIVLKDAAYMGIASVTVEDFTEGKSDLFSRPPPFRTIAITELPGNSFRFWTVMGPSGASISQGMQYKLSVIATAQGFSLDVNPTTYRSLIAAGGPPHGTFAYWVYLYLADGIRRSAVNQWLNSACLKELRAENKEKQCSRYSDQVAKLKFARDSSVVISRTEISLQSISLFKD